jgi:simple sugar transport system permease protein
LLVERARFAGVCEPVLRDAARRALAGGVPLDAAAAGVAGGCAEQIRRRRLIGGVSLNGGKGTMFGAFTGILLVYMIQNVLTHAGVPAEWIDALNGAIILMALMVSRVTSGRAQE